MKNAFEPIVLAVCLGLLALAAAGLAYTFPTLEDLTGIPGLEPQGHIPAAVKEDDLQDQLAPLATPQTWNVPDDNHRLFLSDRYLFYASLYPTGNYIQKDDGTATTPGGVLISWLRKYHLDITDPNIDREDPDNDGFSNKTEFFDNSPANSKPDGSKATNPLDPESHPPYLSRLRLAKYDVRPFHIEFVGVVTLDNQNEFQITLLDVPPSGQPPLKKTGDGLGYEGWKVGAYTQNIVNKIDSGTHIQVTEDDSTLELDKPDIGRKVILPLRKIINSEESTAHFVMLMPTEINKEIVVARGKTFQLPMGAPTRYLVVDLGDSGAMIRDTASNQDISVPKLDPAEWNDVPVPPEAANANSH
jgi:hypothetical protein